MLQRLPLARSAGRRAPFAAGTTPRGEGRRGGAPRPPAPARRPPAPTPGPRPPRGERRGGSRVCLRARVREEGEQRRDYFRIYLRAGGNHCGCFQGKPSLPRKRRRRRRPPGRRGRGSRRRGPAAAPAPRARTEDAVAPARRPAVGSAGPRRSPAAAPGGLGGAERRPSGEDAPQVRGARRRRAQRGRAPGHPSGRAQPGAPFPAALRRAAGLRAGRRVERPRRVLPAPLPEAPVRRHPRRAAGTQGRGPLG